MCMCVLVEIQVTMVHRQTRWITSCTFFFILVNVVFSPSWCMILLICLVLWNEIDNPKLVLLSLFAYIAYWLKLHYRKKHSPFGITVFPKILQQLSWYELENAIMFIFLFALLHYMGMVGERICKCEKSLLRIVFILSLPPFSVAVPEIVLLYM
jgi:hypothetical protein